ncbi:bifunctional metallophosphatase/5'-nucleotidase [Sediminibacillus albus]|uniref:2',3'-cyclic-nucleotide 2'-phosphodiesterase/5'-or 3'-nucleotidase, 5'-nucleotidase family n=1 Tax=Sediminibacillus albus TaxID=407036 RepID=A0A1G8YXA6_9BACI|nr:bifunctional UDP-sugar hydrolase/5'-nucleotidase [Sediminibacillus albus]SDK07406.1 2',3'-cyclic-nucleotide 2'-phosphodiesterase/5'-or 3'-nucleotidase, 5'-nucleotidase family [Sediminibacillus albus]
MNEKLFLYYTNDLHSHFENFPQIIGHFKEEGLIRKRNNQSYWFIDIGDHVDRSHPIAEAMKGKANVELLNDSDFDLATVGNNEGITLDYEDLYHLYDHADFQLVCANLTSMEGSQPSWLKPTAHVTSIQGVKVGFIGLTAPFNDFYNLLGWNVDAPFAVLDRYLPALAEESDIVVLLSHLGISDDEEIARRYQDIDVIIGGHTHHLFRDGEYINNTLLTAAGKHGKYVGEVILTWDHQQNKLLNKEAYAIATENFPKDVETEAKLAGYALQAKQKLDQTVVTLDQSLEFGWFKETPIMKKLVETLKDWTAADCAMLNAGVLLDRFDKGNVTLGDIHRICPHPINPCLVSLNGDELMEVIRMSITKQFTELKLKGFGFRGEVLGRMVFSGAKVEIEKQSEGQERVVSVQINGVPLDMEKEYTVATADTFTFGRLLPEIAKSETKQFFMPEFLRDLLAETLKKNFQ